MKNITLFVITTSLLSFSLSSTVNEATIHSEKIVLGSGCFWGAEKGYEALPGVIVRFLDMLMVMASVPLTGKLQS